MKIVEVVKYFADKNMGSCLLNVVSVIWEKLDIIEKEMIRSLKEAKKCTLEIKSNLFQEELERELDSTSFITL